MSERDPLSPARVRPDWVAGWNQVGANVGADRLVPIEPDELVATARDSTGLTDFGHDTWHEPFVVLCEAIAREAHLNTVGRLLTRAELLRILQNRLRIVDAHAQDTTLAAAPVPSPVFITGTARSGTSILHELLAQDPAHRTPAAWEVMYSVPAPRRETYATDDRIATTDREVRFWDAIDPSYLTMHENGGALPLECIFITAHELASEHFSGVLDVPSYAQWMARADLRPAYAWHRTHLQLLQQHTPGAQWVLKAPSHLSALPALFAVYPDAWVVMSHRDPTETVPSTISLMATLRGMRSDRVNVDGLAHVMARGMAALLDHVTAQRDDWRLPADRFVDVAYRDLLHDPIATIGGVYDRIGRPFTAEAERAMRDYLAAKPQRRHGAHRYALSDFGLDESAVRSRFAGYCERYGVAT